MKKTLSTLYLTLLVLCGLVGCTSTKQNSDGKVNTVANDEIDKVVEWTDRNESEYYKGNGGATISLEVEEPILSGNLSDEVQWLPNFTVNMLSDFLAKYSAITIVDKHNQQTLLKLLKEQESGLYDDTQSVELGKFAVAQNILIVNITAKNSSYAISCKVNNKETNTSIAAYSNANCSLADLESGDVLKLAVADILTQLKVELTDKAKNELAEKTQIENTTIIAQKKVAQGQIAASNGNNIQALSYYIQAAQNDENLNRVQNSITQMSTIISSGDIGTQARNIIQNKKDFEKLFEDIREYLLKNNPYMIVYDPNIKLEVDKIDYEKELIPFSQIFTIAWNPQKLKIVLSFLNSLNAQEGNKNWGFDVKFQNLYNELRTVYGIKKDNYSSQFSYKIKSDDYESEEKTFSINLIFDDLYPEFYRPITILDYINAEYDTSKLQFIFSNFTSVPISQYCFDLVRNMSYEKIPNKMETYKFLFPDYYRYLFSYLDDIPEYQNSIKYAFNYFYKDHFSWERSDYDGNYNEIGELRIFDTNITEVLQLSKLIKKGGKYYVLFPEESIPLLDEVVENHTRGGVSNYTYWLFFSDCEKYLKEIYPDINWIRTDSFSFVFTGEDEAFKVFFKNNSVKNQIYLGVVGKK